MRLLTKTDLFRIFVRSFYIQGSWNYQRMLNLGFCYGILPVMYRLYQRPEDRKAFLLRHLEFFNAHPYFASFALGATARLEEQNARELWSEQKPINVLKNRLCGPLGAIGDKLFWGTVKPLVAMLSVLITLFWGLVGPIFLFVMYNIPHLYLRYYGIKRGYELGFDIVRELSKRKFTRYAHLLSLAGLFVFGLFIGYYISAAIGMHNFLLVVIFVVSMTITGLFLYSQKAIILPILINIGLFLGYMFLVGL